jgi:hypothetical protein
MRQVTDFVGAPHIFLATVHVCDGFYNVIVIFNEMVQGPCAHAVLP